MKKIQYKTKTGATQWKPVFNKAFESLLSEGNGEGFCLVCGSEASGCEPDARKYGLRELPNTKSLRS